VRCQGRPRGRRRAPLDWGGRAAALLHGLAVADGEVHLAADATGYAGAAQEVREEKDPHYWTRPYLSLRPRIALNQWRDSAGAFAADAPGGPPRDRDPLWSACGRRPGFYVAAHPSIHARFRRGSSLRATQPSGSARRPVVAQSGGV